VTRRWPIIPTIIVLGAVAVLIGLGVWQLQRLKTKEALIARYAQAERLPPIVWPTLPMKDSQLPLFRHATGVCLRPVGKRVVGGESASGEPGFVQIVDCVTGAEGPGMSVAVGWSKNPNAKVNWPGGPVSGVIGPDKDMRMRLVAATAPPGLEPVAPPSLSSIPNNHMQYAVTWFLFAMIAPLIYVLALRSRWTKAAA
jgi:surfeit locus 1 family protein